VPSAALMHGPIAAPAVAADKTSPAPGRGSMSARCGSLVVAQNGGSDTPLMDGQRPDWDWKKFRVSGLFGL